MDPIYSWIIPLSGTHSNHMFRFHQIAVILHQTFELNISWFNPHHSMSNLEFSKGFMNCPCNLPGFSRFCLGLHGFSHGFPRFFPRVSPSALRGNHGEILSARRTPAPKTRVSGFGSLEAAWLKRPGFWWILDGKMSTIPFNSGTWHGNCGIWHIYFSHVNYPKNGWWFWWDCDDSHWNHGAKSHQL